MVVKEEGEVEEGDTLSSTMKASWMVSLLKAAKMRTII